MLSKFKTHIHYMLARQVMRAAIRFNLIEDMGSDDKDFPLTGVLAKNQGGKAAQKFGDYAHINFMHMIPHRYSGRIDAPEHQAMLTLDKPMLAAAYACGLADVIVCPRLFHEMSADIAEHQYRKQQRDNNGELAVKIAPPKAHLITDRMQQEYFAPLLDVAKTIGMQEEFDAYLAELPAIRMREAARPSSLLNYTYQQTRYLD